MNNSNSNGGNGNNNKVGYNGYNGYDYTYGRVLVKLTWLKYVLVVVVVGFVVA